MNLLTAAREDALKAIYALLAGDQPLSNNALARELGVSAPSASAMTTRLEEDGLVWRPAPRRVALTDAGERAALRVIRRQRLLETFLVEVLELPWDEVLVEAERLEHALSDRLTNVLDAKLGYPTVDPHGDPIPAVGQRHRESYGQCLHEASVGSVFRIERVHDRDPATLRRLAEIGAVPGAVVRVEDRGPDAEPLWVLIGDQRYALGGSLVAHIHGRTERVQ